MIKGNERENVRDAREMIKGNDRKKMKGEVLDK